MMKADSDRKLGDFPFKIKPLPWGKAFLYSDATLIDKMSAYKIEFYSHTNNDIKLQTDTKNVHILQIKLIR